MIRVQPTANSIRSRPVRHPGGRAAEKRSERPYSIVSSPYESELEFFFELVPMAS